MDGDVGVVSHFIPSFIPTLFPYCSKLSWLRICIIGYNDKLYAGFDFRQSVGSYSYVYDVQFVLCNERCSALNVILDEI